MQCTATARHLIHAKSYYHKLTATLRIYKVRVSVRRAEESQIRGDGGSRNSFTADLVKSRLGLLCEL